MRKHIVTICVKTLIFVTVLAAACPASAHKIKLFATVENQTITGYGYFPGGGKYRNGMVTVSGPEGLALGEVTTDDNGEFSFTAQYKCDHTFSIETTDGHAAQYTVKADELPDTLPPLPGSNNAGVQQGAEQKSPSPIAQGETSAPTGQEPLLNKDGVTSPDLARLIDSIVARHVRPLREQLEEYEQKVRLHDVLGGIGYIFGVAGIAMYLASRKKGGRRD